MSIHIPDAGTARRHADAIRDILYLYRDLVAYDGIVGDHDLGSFDPWAFLNATAGGGWATPDDLRLVHEGSAVSLLCDLVDEFEQRGGEVNRFRAALSAGRFDHLPVARQALETGIHGVDALLDAARPVYEEYVLGCFAAFAARRRHPGQPRP